MATIPEVYDVIMVGAGPSALAAAVYTTREDIKTLLIEKGAIGGLAAITDVVDNYPGFPDGVRGLQLAEQFEKQAERFGAKIEFGEVTGLHDKGDYKEVITTDGTMRAKTVLIATGSAYKMLHVPGEQEYYGKGVHYCATCDGAFYRDKKLLVVGGGNSAVQETLFLTRYASHITMLVRNGIKASDVLQKELQKYVDDGKVTVQLQTAVTEITAKDGKVTGAAVQVNGQSQHVVADGIFVFIGLLPNTDFLKSTAISLDKTGFVKTDAHLMTTMPGVFASGDVRSGATMQIASATGEGATAALSIREYIEGRLTANS